MTRYPFAFGRQPVLTRQQEVAALFNQGLAFHQQGQLAQAQAAYERLLAIEPRHFDALHLLGVVAAQSGNPAMAASLIGKAIDINPDHPQAHANRGNALRDLERFEEAVASYDRAIALEPGYALAYSNRGNALRDLERLEEALASYDAALRIAPDYAQAHSNRGNVLQELGRLDEALACYERAIELAPDYAEAFANRGNALQGLRREEAIASFDRAIELDPGYGEAYANRGVALKEFGRLQEALASYDRAIALGYDAAHWNKGLALLLDGQLESGWALYEWRWKDEKSSIRPRAFTQPLWLGEEDLAGKTILLHAEQGFGDTIQFCRYARLVKARGARVLLEVQRPLISLLSGLEGVDELLVAGEPLPAFDCHCPLLSLPLAFRTSLADIPSPTPYLAADADKRAAWAQRLGDKTRPRVGLAWSGSLTHKNDLNRSLALATLLAHLPQGCEYVSLQKEVRESDRDALARSAVRHYGELLENFSDTAALCDLMDVVVSVDTSVAHLAGALGKTTWALLPFVPDWRWLMGRSDTPWYASVSLYRQDRQMRWDPVLALLAQDLQRLST